MGVEDIEIRLVRDLEDCRSCRKLAADVWGSDSACSAAQMWVHAKFGGVVILACERATGTSVGFVLSFPALYRGETVLWSHETAVLPAYLHRGIGADMKRLQRREAGAMGYRHIAWTFDPLVARNAHFNLNKLGARVVEYRVNAYGIDQLDQINRGIETDRFIARWNVTGAEEHEVSQDSKVHGHLADGRGDDRDIRTPVPKDFELLLRHHAREAMNFRLHFRLQAQSLLSTGYQVIGFERTDHESAYLWRKTGVSM